MSIGNSTIENPIVRNHRSRVISKNVNGRTEFLNIKEERNTPLINSTTKKRKTPRLENALIMLGKLTNETWTKKFNFEEEEGG